jgi:hypothetical protein
MKHRSFQDSSKMIIHLPVMAIFSPGNEAQISTWKGNFVGCRNGLVVVVSSVRSMRRRM